MTFFQSLKLLLVETFYILGAGVEIQIIWTIIFDTTSIFAGMGWRFLGGGGLIREECQHFRGISVTI